MGCLVEQGYDGRELEVHKFDSKENALSYLRSLGAAYTFDRHEPWAFTSGIDFYNGPMEGDRASLRFFKGFWQLCFWNNGRN